MSLRGLEDTAATELLLRAVPAGGQTMVGRNKEDRVKENAAEMAGAVGEAPFWHCAIGCTCTSMDLEEEGPGFDHGIIVAELPDDCALSGRLRNGWHESEVGDAGSNRGPADAG